MIHRRRGRCPAGRKCGDDFVVRRYFGRHRDAARAYNTHTSILPWFRFWRRSFNDFHLSLLLEQPDGEFSSANEVAGAIDETVQVSRTCAAFLSVFELS